MGKHTLDLDAIKHRVRDCLSYNFGMVNADRLAHGDAPILVAEVERLTAELEKARRELSAQAVIASPRQNFIRDGTGR